MPSLPSQWNHDVQVVSMQPASIPNPEYYIPLWWGGLLSTTFSANTSRVQKGNSSPAASLTSATTLHTLNNAWSPLTKYALECALSVTSSTTNAQLYDITAASFIAGSLIQASSGGTLAVLRSAQFTLIPGHTYAVSVWAAGGQTTNLTDLSLIVFPQ